MHSLIITTGEKGHLNPMVGVAQALQTDGDVVSWLCLPAPVPQLRALGVQIVDMPCAPGDELVTQGPELAALVRDEPRLARWIEQLLLDTVSDAIEPMREVLRRVRPDVVVLDPMLYAAVLAAHLEGVPYVAVSSSLNPVTPDDWDVPLTRVLSALSGRRQALFERYGLSPTFKVADCLSPYGTIVFTTEAYVGGLPVPPRVHLVGPSIPLGSRGDEVDFPWDRLRDGRPLVFASFGSQISWQPEVFSAIVEASGDVDLVISCGELSRTRWPDHVIAVDYAPQRRLLERAAVFITHGGANSVMEALTAGVPMLMAPVCNDQWLQARFLELRGAGVLLRETLWQPALRSLLSEAHPARAAAGQVSDAYRKAGGVRQAARIVRDVARKERSARDLNRSQGHA